MLFLQSLLDIIIPSIEASSIVVLIFILWELLYKKWKFHKMKIFFYIKVFIYFFLFALTIIFLIILLQGFYLFNSINTYLKIEPISAITLAGSIATVFLVIVTFLYSKRNIEYLKKTRTQEIETRKFPKVLGFDYEWKDINHDKKEELLIKFNYNSPLCDIIFKAYDMDKKRIENPFMFYDLIEALIPYSGIHCETIDSLGYAENEKNEFVFEFIKPLENLKYISVEYLSEYLNPYLNLYELVIYDSDWIPPENPTEYDNAGTTIPIFYFSPIYREYPWEDENAHWLSNKYDDIRIMDTWIDLTPRKISIIERIKKYRWNKLTREK